MQDLKERFDLTLKYKSIAIYDARHALEEFKKHFPSLTIEDYKKCLRSGIDKIILRYGRNSNNYMIQSNSLGIRIPLEIRKDRQSGLLIGVTPTTLAKHEQVNLRNEIEVFVESKQYSKFEETVGFNTYTQNGRVFSDYEQIDVD